MKRTYHVVFKESNIDFYSKGQNFEVNEEDEVVAAQLVLALWNKDYSRDKYPNRQIMAMYPLNIL